MPLSENNLIVHSKHFKDGYPLCWSMDRMGTFEGSYDEGAVTFKKCIKLLQE